MSSVIFSSGVSFEVLNRQICRDELLKLDIRGQEEPGESN